MQLPAAARFRKIAVFLTNGAAFDRNFGRFGIAAGQIGFVPRNNKIVLHVAVNDRNPVHGNITGLFAAQFLVRTVILVSKTVKRRLGQFDVINFYRCFAVGADSQNILGFSTEHNLSHGNGIRRHGNRHFAVINNAELKIVGQRAGIADVKRVVIVGKTGSS